MTVLGLETAGRHCAVALASDGRILAAEAAGRPQAHAETLLPLIGECLGAAVHPDAIAVASGPGSFTGLRIGYSTAKGICFARSLPLIEIPTFDAWAAAASAAELVPPGTRMLMLMAAGRDEAFAAIHRRNERTADAEAPAAVMAVADLPAFSREAGAVITDDGARAAAWLPGAPRIIEVSEAFNPAAAVALLGEQRALAGRTSDLRTAEPLYLKEVSVIVKGA